MLVLFDARTLTPLATLDSAALTALRTPALSALAVARLAHPEARRLVVFGTGVQAWAHVAALREVRDIDEVRVVGRDAARLSHFLDRCRRLPGLDAQAGRPSDVAEADIIACCTTAREPLCDGALPKSHTTIVAIGSHDASAREVDEVMVRRSTVVVDGRAAAAREAGDLLLNDALDGVRGTIADLVAKRVVIAPDRPRLFKSVGMAWQDLAVAVQVYEAAAGRAEQPKL
ncbi:ornithine cyclodeaminase family protein [Actinoplanes sp. NPDC051475]|uniref:ornithine cyclodeaminase family protein n=1 Tax=Actinoplanes sp. NPDC051475 TaxID=3157225 RepID=UPI00344DEA6D